MGASLIQVDAAPANGRFIAPRSCFLSRTSYFQYTLEEVLLVASIPPHMNPGEDK